MKFIAAVTILGTLCVAQTSELSSRETPITFSSRVNLVLVPVVVRDATGRALGNLRIDDFQLFDKGKPQVITRFSVERPSAPFVPAITATPLEEATDVQKSTRKPEPIPERFIAYLFDDLHMKAEDLLQGRQAALKHIEESSDPSARSAIFTTSAQVIQDFTDDRDQLRAALIKIQPMASLRNPQECPDLTFYWADAIVNKSGTEEEQALNAATDEVMACSQITDRQSAAAQARAAAFSAVSKGENDSRIALSTLNDVARRLSAAPGSRNLLLVSPGFYLTNFLRREEMDLMDRAIKSNITINSLDVRGVYTVIPGGDASQIGRLTPSATNLLMLMDINSKSEDSNIMAELADATGGAFFHNDNGLSQGLKQLITQPEYVYILGFSPQNLKNDGSYHSLKVTLRNPKGLEMQVRRGYYAPDHAINREEQAKEEIRSAVFSRDEVQELPVDLSLQYARTGDISARVNVLAKIDVKLLHFRKAEERNLDTLTVVASIFDRNGNFVSGIQRVIDMRLRDQTLDSLAGGLTVKTTLDVTPGTYMVRLVVRDSEGEAMAARNGVVEIP